MYRCNDVVLMRKVLFHRRIKHFVFLTNIELGQFLIRHNIIFVIHQHRAVQYKDNKFVDIESYKICHEILKERNFNKKFESLISD